MGSFADPTQWLTDVPEPEESLEDGYVDPADVIGALSATQWIIELVKELTGHDLLLEIGQWFVGDWAAFAKCGEAYSNIGNAMQDIGSNVQVSVNNV